MKFNEEIGDKISSDFGVLVLGSIAGFVEWYNTYIEDSTDDNLPELSYALEDFIVGDMQELLISDSLNIVEMEIYDRFLITGKEINIRTLEELKIEIEDTLRNKNLKELSDEEFEKLKNRKENHINTIKDLIEDILKEYFEQ